ncbi:MAG: glycosyltransferase family 2 protein [bacterium]|nr:glycosyltransferase family 2 protein [bacterium]
MPLFTVIIPTYNRYELLKRAIDSVVGQTMTDFELIIVDDGSSDETYSIEKEYPGRLKYLRQENAGVSAARNTGIRAADSPYITLLDSDDTWFPGKLEAHREYIQAHPEIKIHQTEDIWIRNGKRVNPKHKHTKPEGDIFLNSLELCLISPSAVCMNRELFDIYGFFDEKLPACEDYDLWLEISAREYIGLVNSPLITRYAGHNDQLSSSYWGMDRFRVYAIIKLLKNSERNTACLKEEYAEKAGEIALQKLEILKNGALKRGRADFARDMEQVILQLKSRSYDETDLSLLL